MVIRCRKREDSYAKQIANVYVLELKIIVVVSVIEFKRHPVLGLTIPPTYLMMMLR